MITPHWKSSLELAVTKSSVQWYQKINNYFNNIVMKLHRTISLLN